MLRTRAHNRTVDDLEQELFEATPEDAEKWRQENYEGPENSAVVFSDSDSERVLCA